MIQVTIDSDGWVIVQLTKMTLVLSKPQFVEALRRGKRWKRQQAMAARHAKEPIERRPPV